MAERLPPDAPNAIELSSPQPSRVWIAVWLALGGALLTFALVAAMGELFLALKRPLFEAIFALGGS